MARTTMAALGHETASTHLVAQSFNTVVGAVGEDGVQRAVRVGAPEKIHHPQVEALEATWLSALADDGVPVASVVKGPSGQAVIAAEDPENPGSTRACVTFDWIDGTTVRDAPTEQSVTAAGRALALIHEHALGDRTPRAASLQRGPALSCANPLRFALDDRMAEVSTVDGGLIPEAMDRASGILRELWRNGGEPHLLHGDLHLGNVMVSPSGALTVIDFQDLAWGFDIHDLAITIRSFTALDGAAQVLAAFRTGYQSVRPWPDTDPATVAALTAARDLEMINLGLNLRRPGLEEFLEKQIESVRKWMTTPATSKGISRRR